MSRPPFTMDKYATKVYRDADMSINPVDDLTPHVLEFVQMVEDGGAKTEDGSSFPWATWFWEDGYQPENSVMHVLPQDWTTTRGRAFMRLLGRRGLVAGCHCGCRGEYVLTEAGRRVLTRG